MSNTKQRPVYEIAAEIRQDWKNVYFGAKPYLDAMHTLSNVSERYGVDSATSIISYFLANAGTWKGDVARRITEGKVPHKITVTELELILTRIDGNRPTFINMVTATVPSDMRKKGNPYADKEVYTVHKISKYSAQINFNYSNAVNNQLEREGKEADFEATMNWHKKKFDEFNGCICSKAEGNQKQWYCS